MELVTKTRTEHLTDQDKKKTEKKSRTPLESFLGIAEQQEKIEGAGANGVSLGSIEAGSIERGWEEGALLMWTGRALSQRLGKQRPGRDRQNGGGGHGRANCVMELLRNTRKLDICGKLMLWIIVK